MCYSQADQQALDLVQVKAHDISAFVASKGFYDGVLGGRNHPSLSLEGAQHLHNFFLSDNDNSMYLGPLVASQQVLDASPQNSHPRGEKKEGGGGVTQPLQ